jgi:hypothetical protein
MESFLRLLVHTGLGAVVFLDQLLVGFAVGELLARGFGHHDRQDREEEITNDLRDFLHAVE